MGKSNIPIFITGGHITPALAVVEEIRRRFPHWNVMLIGRQFALEGVRVVSEEKRLANKYTLPFKALITGRLTRVLSLWTLLSLLKIPVGFVQSFWFIATKRPRLIVSFGGYIALPVVFAGKLLQVPIITHEQTRVTGLTNRILSMFADRVCVSFEDQREKSGSTKIIYTGLPIRRGVFAQSKPPAWIDTKFPLVFFTGGSTGSTSLNEIVFKTVDTLTKKFMVVHQTGRLSLREAARVQQKLPKDQKSRYAPTPYIDPPDYGWVLQHARLVIGRSGANTVGEVAALGKVALWIPLPWSAGGEQWENARYLEQRGTSVVLAQSSVTDKVLEQKIHEMHRHFDQFEKKAQLIAQAFPKDAATRIVDVASTLLSKAS